jgi:hypothetical protein
MSLDDLLKRVAGTPLPEEHLQRPLTLTFDQFLRQKYQADRHNLYIVRTGKQALYVGISRSDVWGRWFAGGEKSHMYFAQKYSGTREGGRWLGHSSIGQVVEFNFPRSLKWKVELRHYSTFSWTNNEKLEEAERRLIRELRPLFNEIYRGSLTEKEIQLAERLRYGRSL